MRPFYVNMYPEGLNGCIIHSNRTYASTAPHLGPRAVYRIVVRCGEVYDREQINQHLIEQRRKREIELGYRTPSRRQPNDP